MLKPNPPRPTAFNTAPSPTEAGGSHAAPEAVPEADVPSAMALPLARPAQDGPSTAPAAGAGSASQQRCAVAAAWTPHEPGAVAGLHSAARTPHEPGAAPVAGLHSASRAQATGGPAAAPAKPQGSGACPPAGAYGTGQGRAQEGPAPGPAPPAAPVKPRYNALEERLRSAAQERGPGTGRETGSARAVEPTKTDGCAGPKAELSALMHRLGLEEYLPRLQREEVRDGPLRLGGGGGGLVTCPETTHDHVPMQPLCLFVWPSGFDASCRTCPCGASCCGSGLCFVAG